jgi:hypothetical protein
MTKTLTDRAKAAYEQHCEEVRANAAAERSVARLAQMKKEEEAIDYATSLDAIASLGHDDWRYGEELDISSFTMYAGGSTDALKVRVDKTMGTTRVANPHDMKTGLAFTDLVSFGAALGKFDREEQGRKREAAREARDNCPG